MNDEQVSLSALQLSLMRALWGAGQATAAEVVLALREERALAYTTVSTLLTRLEKRGIVEAERQGRQIVYRPLISESQVRQSMVAGLLANLFEGRASDLLSHLIKRDEIGAEDLARIRKLLDTPRGADHE
jgi:BlaI family penicillinase repressor